MSTQWCGGYGGKVIPFSTTIKYLVVILDSQMRFKAHNNTLRIKANQLVNKILCFARNKFGLNSLALEVIYKGCILPILSYAVSVWVDAIDYDYNKRYLTEIQSVSASPEPIVPSLGIQLILYAISFPLRYTSEGELLSTL